MCIRDSDLGGVVVPPQDYDALKQAVAEAIFPPARDAEAPRSW